MTCWIYEGIYFGLMDVYTMDEKDFFDGFDYEMRHEKDIMDFYFGVSRDGRNFDKSWIHARKPLVPRGAAFQRLYRRAGLPARLFAAVSEALQHLNEELCALNSEDAPAEARRRVNALVRHRDFDNPEFEATLLMMEAG